VALVGAVQRLPAKWTRAGPIPNHSNRIKMFFLSRLASLCLALILLTLSIDGVACSGRLHIEVLDSGVYALDYAEIVAQQPGLADCASNDLVMLNHGKEVPIRLRDDGSGRFADGNRIEWVGQPLHGPQSWYDEYSTVNVYLLGAVPGEHARMRELHAGPGPANALAGKPASLRRTQHFEQENLMLRLNGSEMKPGDEPDVWQWAKLTPIDAQPFTYKFDLADVDLARAAAGADSALTLNLRGVSNVLAAPNTAKPADHVIEASLNGKLLARIEWDGRDEMRKVLSVAHSLLRAQGNTISLRVPKRPVPKDTKNFIVDVAMFNWMEVTYPVRGNLAASAAPFRASAHAPIELVGDAADNPQLYSGDGTYRMLTPMGNDRLRAAAADADADADAELYPVRDGQLPSPALILPVAAADLHADTTGYDYLIVAHPRLLQAIQPLAKYHREHGHTVAVIDVNDIYDQFNDGIIHPVAIRDLVAWGTQHWATKPRYLLLVGDASTEIHHDPRNGALNGFSYQLTPRALPNQVLTGEGFREMLTTPYAQSDRKLPNRNLIPTWQFPTGEGQSASDNDFVTMKAGDFHPTLAVGRFPVVEADEVEAIVDKTLAYLSKPTPGSWHRDVTFISTSELASFKKTSDKIAADLDSQGFATTSIYTDANDKDAGRYKQARATLRDDLDAGNLLVHFLGHGGSYIWRVGAMGDLFSLEDVSKLNNAGRYPMVLAMTCFSAPFDNPTDDSIGERFLREANKGAVAVFASSWKNSPNPEHSRSLIEELLKKGNPIGDAIVAAKAKITDRDFVEMYNLLGDPALVLARPQGNLDMVRSADRWNPQVLVRLSGLDFGGEVDVDWIDADGKVLTSQHYQARNVQFALTPVDKAATVSVYAADTRNGNTAAGALSLLPPPKPAVAAAGARSAVPAPAPAAPVVPEKARPATEPAKPPRDPHDTITRLDFDSAPIQALPRAAASKHTAAVAP
jgi:Peptidase family C25